MKTIKDILLYIWQLPQNLAGLVLLGWYYMFGVKPKKYLTLDNVDFYHTASMPSGISLGEYVIMDYPYNRRANDVKHEFGHTKQSKILGWFYLIVIGILSLACNIVDRLFHKKWNEKDREVWYYNLPWEKWADKLGGVKR